MQALPPPPDGSNPGITIALAGQKTAQLRNPPHDLADGGGLCGQPGGAMNGGIQGVPLMLCQHHDTWGFGRVAIDVR